MDARRVGRGMGTALFWVVLGLEVFTMGEAGLGKFDSMEGWMYWFARFGYPPLMAPFVGAIEFAGAGLLLIPSLAPYAALVLGAVMTGALHAVLTTPTDLGWFDPALHLVFLTIIGSVRWHRRWRPGRSPATAPDAPEGT